MNTNAVRTTSTWIRRLACVTALVALVRPDSAEATLTLDFTTPATNSAEGAAWIGDITYPTGTYDTFDVTVTRGEYIVPASSIATFVGTDRGSISLTPLPDQSGRVFVDVDASGGTPHGSNSDSISFEVVFLPVPTNPVALELDFDSPATNAAPGATFSGDILYTPADPSVYFTAEILSGDLIVPQTNVTLLTNSAAGVLTAVLEPLTNRSGEVTVRITGEDTFTTNDVTFAVEFRQYPPDLSFIDDVTMDEDTTTDVDFTLSYPDGTLPGNATLSVAASNTTLIDASGLVLEGTGSNRTLRLTPRPDMNGESTITVTATDEEYVVNRHFLLTVDPVPDAPTISGANNVSTMDNTGTVAILPDVVIADVDHNMPDAETLTVTVTLGNIDLATFVDGSTSYVTSGSPSAVTLAVRDLQILPTPFRGPPESVNNLGVTVSVEDAVFRVEEAINVAITVSNNDPSLFFTLTPDTVVEGTSIQPFTLEFLHDPDQGDDQFTLVIEIADAAQTNLGSFSPTNTLTGNESTLQSALGDLLFVAAEGHITSTNPVVVPLRMTAFDGFGGSGAETNVLTIFPALTPPSISGIEKKTVSITDGSPGEIAFPTVYITDPDQGGDQLVRAALTQSNPALGSFSPQTVFALQPQDQLTAALRDVVYTPTPGALPVGADADTVLTVNVTDATGLTSQNNNLTLNVRSVNNAPRILNVPDAEDQPVRIPPAVEVFPFREIGLTNDDTNDVIFTIAIDNPDKGTLSNLGGFTSAGAAGTFEMEASVSEVLSSLTNITYTLNAAFPFPLDDPGGTTFGLSARDYALLTTTLDLYIQIQGEPRNHLVVRAATDGQPGSLTYALNHAGNNDVITFALASYPAVIRMPGVLADVLTRNLSIKGPGASLLTISGDNNGDGVPNRRIFSVKATVLIEGVTLSHGTAAFGGGVQVLEDGTLTLRSAAVVDCVATEYGGGIDVDGGRLVLDGAFIGRNRLAADTGKSGAGVAVYSDRQIQIVNSTFADNLQANPSGDGGGALAVENRTRSTILNVELAHTTFAGNLDARERASAVFSIGENTYIRPAHSIFNDLSGRNLSVIDGGLFESRGGNICDDSTQVPGQQAGQPGAVYLLDHLNDLTLTDPGLTSLNLRGDPTPFFDLTPGSPAVDTAYASTASVDQRNVARVGIPDAGAIEYAARGRLVINEIMFDDGELNFVELYVRRDSTPLDLSPYTLFVDGVPVHEFAAGTIIGTNAVFDTVGVTPPLTINPGFGMVVAFTETPFAVSGANNPTPVVGASQTPVAGLRRRGVITVGVGGTQQPVARQAYLGTFLDPASGTNLLNIAGNTIALAPQFRGFAMLPHALILPGPFEGANVPGDPLANTSSLGADVLGTPFGQDNAEPLARNDLFVVAEDDLAALDVLANDFDGDGNDRIVIVDVSTLSGAGTGELAVTVSALGASVVVDPAGMPLRGDRILYDPRHVPLIQELPVGVEAFDSFFYEILDFGAGAVEAYAEEGGVTKITATHHRLTNGAAIVISEAGTAAYNGTHVVSVPDGDTFTIPVAFVNNTPPRGTWQTVLPRSPTSRSEGSVSVRLAGVNDPPIAVPDVITNVTERSTVRIMTRPELAGSTIVFPTTDPVPAPDMLDQDLLRNDEDVDTDDTWSDLRVAGIMASVNTILNYTGTVGELSVSVRSANHGLDSGDQVLIANYGGHPSYNGYHAVSVVDADTFTIPRFYVDDHAQKGVWVTLNDGNRYSAVSEAGAAVEFVLRADPLEDHLLYDANTSAFLRGLAENELYADRFWYAVEDRHGAIGIGPVTMIVEGVNDPPIPVPDPDSLGVLTPLLSASNSLEEVLRNGLDLLYTRPPASGGTDRADLHVLDRSGTLEGTVVLRDFFTTDEDTTLDIAATNLLANDGEIDRVDELVLLSADPVSREGALLSLSGGVLSYDPTGAAPLQALAREEMVVDTFSVVVSDLQTGGEVSSLVAVLVVGVNDAPTANPVVLTTHEDETFVFDPRLNDVDPDINGVQPDDRLGVVPVADWPNPGQARVDMTTTNIRHDATVSDLLNQLAVGQSFTNVFEYSITDNSFLFAVADEFYVPAETTEAVLDVLANDRDFTDAEGDLVIIDAGPTLRGGSARIASNATHLVYSSPAGFVGDDVFRYTIRNDRGDIARAVVQVRSVVPALNGVLHAANDRYAVAAGETIQLDVTANDHMLPETGSGLTLVGIVHSSIPGQPVLTNNAIVYTATNDASELTFRYEVTAGGTAVAQADVRVDVIERRGRLVIQDDAFSVLAGSFDNALDVLGNDLLVTEPTAHLRIREIVTPAMHGTLTTNAARTRLVYTPAPDFIGVDEFQYVASDQVGGTGTGTVHVSVGRIETVRNFFTVEATNTSPVVLDVLENDRMLPNPRSSTLRLVSVEPVTLTPIGTLAVNGPGDALVFTASGSIGQHDFTYVVEDGASPPRSATGIVTVDTVPAGTYANPDLYAVRGNGSDVVLDVLANDIGFPTEGRITSIVAVGTGDGAPDQGGAVAIVDDRLRYTPAAGFFGVESFVYTMSDGTATDEARVTVSVRRGDLVANDDHVAVYYEVPEGAAEPRSFTLPVVLNDRIQPPMDQVITLSDLGVGTNAPSRGGSVAIASDGLSVVYRPPSNSVPAPEYIETFTYEIQDGTGRRDAATVRVRVRNLVSNLVAVTQDDAFTVARNSTGNLLPVLANDFVRPGTAEGWVITEVSPSTSGARVDIAGDAVRYSPTNDFVGVDQFTYFVSDGLGASGSATVRVRVGSLPTMPDRFTVLSDSSSNVFDVLANDVLVDADRDEYTLHSVFGATGGGTPTVNAASNTVFYSPDPSYAGAYPYTESFFYRVSDDASGAVTGKVDVIVHEAGSDRSTGTVSLTVEGRNDSPWILNDAPEISITDRQEAMPFTAVTIVEVDAQFTERVDVLVGLDDAAKGTLRNLDEFRELGDGRYALTNVTGAAATAQIRGLIFTPTENRIEVPTTETTMFTVSVTDNRSPAVLNTNSIVDVTAVNDSPLLSGTEAGQEFYYQSPIQPFRGVSIAEVDDNAEQLLSVTLTILEQANGRFGGIGDFVEVSGGVYWAEGITAAEATAQLRAMAFFAEPDTIPFGGSRETHFRITVNDGFAPPVEDSNASVIARHSFAGALRPALDSQRGAFGLAVDTAADYAIVGAPNASVQGLNSGAAFIYQRDTAAVNSWSQWRQLQPATVEAGDRFGRAVAITDELAAVGAMQDDTGGADAGAVYLFERDLDGTNNWGERLRIVATNLTAGARFGLSVALDGDLLAVGAPDADVSGAGLKAGAVFLFGRHHGGTNAWGEIRRWAPSDAGSANGLFGWSVALSDDRLMVGAPAYNATGSDAVREGAVFFLSRDAGGTGQWNRVQTLLPADTASAREFGWDVTIDGDLAAVGAPDMMAGAVTNAGRVFLYEVPDGTNTFALVRQLDRRDDPERRFGHSVSVSGHKLLVGAPHTSGPLNIGAAYLFDRPDPAGTNWTLVEKLMRPAGNTAGLFGTAVRCDQGIGIVGAPADLEELSNRGYAFMYRFGYGVEPVLSYSLALDPMRRLHGSEAATGQTFRVIANAFWTATRPASDAWISITDGSSGGGNGTVTYSVSSNQMTMPRSGTITVSGGGLSRTFTVDQAGTDAVLEISPSQRDHDADAAVGQTIEVTGNIAWTAATSDGWITIDSGAFADGNGTVSYSIATNHVTTARNGAITVSGGGITNVFTVNQVAAEAVLSIAPSGRDHPPATTAGQTIEVTGNVDWTVSQTSAWITITGGSSGDGNGTVTYSVDTNRLTTPRSAAITVSGGGITNVFLVNQAAADAVLTISPSGRNHPASPVAGQTIDVAGNIGWTATAAEGWITITAGASGNGGGTVTYGLSANVGMVARGSTITVEGGGITNVFAVNQAGSPPPVPLEEAVDAPDLVWTTGGAANWFGQTETTHDGVDAGQSGAITDNQQTWMQTTVTGPGIIRFWWKVSSEANADVLRFSANGVELDSGISGETGWVRKEWLIPSGDWTLRWFYTKSLAGSAGQDRGWVDQVEWISQVVPNDFDGDGSTDVAVFHPASAMWYLLRSNLGAGQLTWGWSEVMPVPGDYDGDGTTDVAVYHPGGGAWYLLPSSTGSLRQERWGWSEAVPVPGDYDGDGKTDIAVYHPEGGTWYILQSSTGAARLRGWGWSEAVPVPGDYDGDGKTDIAVYHPGGGTWYILQSSTGSLRQESWGWSESVPVPGDYDGDGKADIAVYHPGGGAWYILQSSTGATRQQGWGWSEAVPVPGDYDGDGKADIAVYHPAGGAWYILQSSTGRLRQVGWGWSEAEPVLPQYQINAWMLP